MPSILRSLFADRYAANDPGPWSQGMVRWGSPTHGPVSVDQAMRLSAVFACIRLLSENIATMPLDTFVREGGTRRPYRPRPEYLSFAPPQGSRVEYLSQVMLSLLTDGNAFIATPRDELGEPVTLVVIDPTSVKVERDNEGRIKYYLGGEEFGPLDVMHIKGMSMPGALRGLSPLSYAAETADLGLSAQQFGAAFFANGALPAGIIESQGDFPEKSRARMAETWNARHRGAHNAGRLGVLTGGAKFVKVTIAPEEAQFLETRQFQVPDIARFFGVPPHLIADASNSTSWGSGLAEQNSAFGQLSLRPWVYRIEDGHDRLLSTHGLSTVFTRLNMDAVLRADTRERYAAYEIGIKNGFLLRSEVRTLEDLRPVTGIDDAPLPERATTEVAP